MTQVTADGVRLLGGTAHGAEQVLTPEALGFVAALHREFGPRREALLRRRVERQAEFDAGARPDFPAETADVRRSEWRVAPAPADLTDRRVEITGPAERKMMINALNSGASVFMADLEDALSPTWANIVEGQRNLFDAVRGTLTHTGPDGREYRLAERTATLVVRPRGWHLEEKHVEIDGAPVSASLFDFGLYLHHNARELIGRGTGPYLYLPKLESRHEARLWNDVFLYAQDALGIPRGSIRATVLIETIPAAFEMDEILHELREHAAGLNAGRWDYIFSLIKRFRHDPGLVLPDRAQVTMDVPFMRAYARLLVQTCHRRGAHAIGGMAAFIPSRKDPAVNETALAKVREDKLREAGDGFDGTWVAHPDLVPVAREVFDEALGAAPNQLHRTLADVSVSAADLLDLRIPGARITPEGAAHNVRVALEYMAAWLGGRGAVAIANLMEDAATAEISRAQLWQWLRHDAGPLTREAYRALRERELHDLIGAHADAAPQLGDAARLLDEIVLDDDFAEFLTVRAYPSLP